MISHKYQTITPTVIQMEGSPPRPHIVSDDLISALQHLEASASSDAAVSERIAKLPPELSDVATVEKLVTEDQARKQLEQLESASSLLTEYNKRLEEELRDRTRVGKMVADFLTAQKNLLVQVDQILLV